MRILCVGVMLICLVGTTIAEEDPCEENVECSENYECDGMNEVCCNVGLCGDGTMGYCCVMPEVDPCDGVQCDTDLECENDDDDEECCGKGDCEEGKGYCCKRGYVDPSDPCITLRCEEGEDDSCEDANHVCCYIGYCGDGFGYCCDPF